MPTNIYLASCLAPLGRHLDRSDVTDIYINRPREIWLETCGGAISRVDVPELTPDVLLRMARQIAAITAQGISREHPLLAASLPTGERVQIAIPPATRGEIAVAIRKHVVSQLKLEEYRIGDEAGRDEEASDEWIPPSAKIDQADDLPVLLRTAVQQRRNILISGGTSSGKTTLLNTLLAEIPKNERLILIEDTPELQFPHENAVGLIAARGSMGEAQVSTEDLLIASLRMRPDRIILGEIRGGEALSFLRAINTGHPGSLSTIHANSPMRAIDQLALLVLQAGARMHWDDVITYVRRSLDVIIQLRRGAQGREISSIYFPERIPV